MTRNQDIAMCILQRMGKSEKVSIYVGAFDYLSVTLYDEELNRVKEFMINTTTSDIKAVQIYNEVIEHLGNEVIDNIDFQQEKQEEMLTSAERDLKAIQEVF